MRRSERARTDRQTEREEGADDFLRGEREVSDPVTRAYITSWYISIKVESPLSAPRALARRFLSHLISFFFFPPLSIFRSFSFASPQLFGISAAICEATGKQDKTLCHPPVTWLTAATHPKSRDRCNKFLEALNTTTLDFFLLVVPRIINFFVEGLWSHNRRTAKNWVNLKTISVGFGTF